MTIIYMAVNMVNNKCYIGQTVQSIEKRKSRHIWDALKGSDLYFHKAIRKYGKEVFSFDILEEVSKEEANNAEIFWISYYRSIGLPLYNLTNGGGGILGRKHTKETKEKISKANSGHKYLLGKHLSEEHKANIGKSNSIASLGNKSRVKIHMGFVSSEGIVYNPIINLSAFCREHNLSRSNMYQIETGKRKIHKGWKLYVPETVNV